MIIIVTKFYNYNSKKIIICDCEYYNNKFYCFDVLYNNKDLRNYKYKIRLKYLDKLPNILIHNFINVNNLDYKNYSFNNRVNLYHNTSYYNNFAFKNFNSDNLNNSSLLIILIT